MFHQTIVMGNVGRDPELRYTPSGSPVTDIGVAVNEFYSGEQHTTWYSVTCWGKTAENVAQYVKKGQLVLCVGRMNQPNAWKGRDGECRAKLEMTAQYVKFGPKAGGSDSDGEEPIGAEDAKEEVKPIEVHDDVAVVDEDDVPDGFDASDIPF